MSVSYRPAQPADASAASRILTAALRELAARQSRPPFVAADDHAAPALRHVAETDGGRFWLAVADGEPVAFGSAWQRGALGYCSGLFVLPQWQGKGVGRRLFELAMDGLPVRGGVAALTSSAANPVSNGIYARHGIYPQHALLYLTGAVASFAQTPTPPSAATNGRAAARRQPSAEIAGVRRPSAEVAAVRQPDAEMAGASRLDVEPLGARHLAELAEIDGVVLGADRTTDHRWFLGRTENAGWLFRRRGRAIGYAYLGGDGTEGASALGPVATLRAADQPAVLRFALAELAARGASQATVAVPGLNIAAQRVLWQAGFSFSGATGLLCASRPFGRFDRYLLAGDCLM